MSKAVESTATCSSGSTCPCCGAGFRCGAKGTACWCAALPPIDPLAIAALDEARRVSIGLPATLPALACFCPTCLASITRALASRSEASATAGRPFARSVAAKTPSLETPEP